VPEVPLLTTERLVLRGWIERDREPFAAINADPEVMKYMPAPLDRAGSDAMIDRFMAYFTELGFGLWAVEERATETLLGFVGLARPRFEASFTPCVEAAWRIASPYHGRGFATEAARAALAFGFEASGLDEIVAFTSAENRPSLRVMAKLGMTHDTREDFVHPLMPADHWLQPMLLHRLPKARWRDTLATCDSIGSS
jgi:RimJ/RimL family protein N-acetyltransferase